MKSANCISQTGRSPTTAAPTAVPMIPDSASGVSITRLGAELVDEAVGDLEGAAEDADVLAHHEARARRRASPRARRRRSPAGRSWSPSSAHPRRTRSTARRRRRADLGLALAEQAVGGRVGVGHRPSPAPPRRRRRSRPRPRRAAPSASTPASRRRASWRSIGSLRAPLLELLLGHVLHVVVRGVAVHAHRHGLDQRRAARRRAPARARVASPRTSPRRRCRRPSRPGSRRPRRARRGRRRTGWPSASSRRTGCSRARR